MYTTDATVGTSTINCLIYLRCSHFTDSLCYTAAGATQNKVAVNLKSSTTEILQNYWHYLQTNPSNEGLQKERTLLLGLLGQQHSTIESTLPVHT